MTEHFNFDCFGEEWTLNGHMIELKGINVDSCEIIAELHREKQFYIGEMKKAEATDVAHLHALYNNIENIEFKMQDKWGFVRDINWHRHWKVPYCGCSIVANKMAYPHHTFYEETCPVHGDIDIAMQAFGLSLRKTFGPPSIIEQAGWLYQAITARAKEQVNEWLNKIKGMIK